MSEPASAPRATSQHGCLRFLFVFAIAVVGIAAGLIFYFGESAKQLLAQVQRGFVTTQTTIKASEILLEMGRTHGDVLEVASPLKTVEKFSKADVRFAAWGWVYLGTATSEVKVPATFRFHIKLSELRQARLDDSVLIVTAPTIYPSLPVAFDTSGMEKQTDGTWLRFDAAQQLADLEKTITPALASRAQEHVKNVRDIARSDVEEFVQKWIVESRPDYRAQIKAVKVIFPGEDARMIDKSTPLP
ncbi:MAG: hypothetical protein ACOYMN_22355 [Roseimicrobium sp.]